MAGIVAAGELRRSKAVDIRETAVALARAMFVSRSDDAHARSKSRTSASVAAASLSSGSSVAAAPSPALNAVPLSRTSPRATCTHACRPSLEGVTDGLAATQNGRVQIDVLMNLDRAVAAVARRDQRETALPIRQRKRPLLVTGWDARAFRQQPDLEKVSRLAVRRVPLAVQDAGAGAHALHVADVDDGTGAQAVFVPQRAFQHVGDDLHVAMRMRTEALSRRDAVFVDHPQGAIAHEAGIDVLAERKRVAAVEPADFRLEPLEPTLRLGQCQSPPHAAHRRRRYGARDAERPIIARRRRHRATGSGSCPRRLGDLGIVETRRRRRRYLRGCDCA